MPLVDPCFNFNWSVQLFDIYFSFQIWLVGKLIGWSLVFVNVRWMVVGGSCGEKGGQGGSADKRGGGSARPLSVPFLVRL